MLNINFENKLSYNFLQSTLPALRIKVNIYQEISYNTIIRLRGFTVDKMLAYLFAHTNFVPQWEFRVNLSKGPVMLILYKYKYLCPKSY